MKALIPALDFDELYGFGPIHKAVLGLPGWSIENVTQDEMAQINAKDRFGRTALAWAAWQGDSAATRALLSQKPDLNIADDYGRTPIIYAARRNRQCVDLLLQASADIHTKDKFQGTLLHHATFRASSGDIEVVKRLLQAGVNINAVDEYKQTALLKTNRVDIAEHLIRQGADARFCDGGGHNALSYAVQLNRHGLISLFLQEQHDHTTWLRYYGTFMHLAAEFGDERTLRILAQGELEFRNVNLENEKGLTPIQVALQRKNVSMEWRDAFWSFLQSVDENRPFLKDSEPLESSKKKPEGGEKVDICDEGNYGFVE